MLWIYQLDLKLVFERKRVDEALYFLKIKFKNPNTDKIHSNNESNKIIILMLK